MKICAWCNRMIERVQAALAGRAPVNHGICPDCLASRLSDLRSSAR